MPLHKGEYLCECETDETTVITRDQYVTSVSVERAAEDAADYFEGQGNYEDEKAIDVLAWNGTKYRVNVTSETRRTHHATLEKVIS